MENVRLVLDVELGHSIGLNLIGDGISAEYGTVVGLETLIVVEFKVRVYAMVEVGIGVKYCNYG